MADSKRVDAGQGGLGSIIDLANLFGGKSTTTKNSADTSQLQAILGQVQGNDPNALLQTIFQKAAGQIPGLQARFSNAVGARSGSNGAVQAMLQDLLKQTTLAGQQQVQQQTLLGQQLQGDLAGKIASLNSKQTQQSGTNLGAAAKGLFGLQLLSKVMDSGLGKKAKGLFDSFGNSDGATDVSSSGVADSFTFPNMDFGSASTSGDVFNVGDFGSGGLGNVGDVFGIGDFLSGSTANAAGDVAGDVIGDAATDNAGDVFDGLWGGFKDGGQVTKDSSANFHENQANIRALVKNLYEMLQLPLGGKATKMGEGYPGNEQAASGAYDAIANMKESMLQDLLVRLQESQGGAFGGKELYKPGTMGIEDGKHYADGGQVSIRTGGGRRSSAPTYQMQLPNTTNVMTGPNSLLNPAPAPATQPVAAPEEQKPARDGNGGQGFDSGKAGFSLGSGTMGNVAASQNGKVAEAFARAMFGMMSPVAIPGITASPISAVVKGVKASSAQQGALDAVNASADPIGALAIANGWLGPEANSAMPADSLSAAANAISALSGIDPMDGLMGLTNGFGTGNGEGGIGIDADGHGYNAGKDSSAANGPGTGADGAGPGGDGDGGGGEGEKNGGMQSGKGTGTSDSIPIRVSDGEYVISSDVVQKLGSSFFDNLQRQFHTPA